MHSAEKRMFRLILMWMRKSFLFHECDKWFVEAKAKERTVTSCDLDGKRVLVTADTTKTKSSMRTLPLVPFMRKRLLALKEEQQENRRLCGRSYIKDYLEYVHSDD